MNLGFDATRCGPAASSVSASYSTCAALLAAETAVCSSDYTQNMVVTTSGTSGNLDNAAAQHSSAGCTLFGRMVGSTVGVATQSMRAFETAANLASIEAACVASGDPESFNFDNCNSVGYEIVNQMCVIYAAAEGGDEAVANQDIAEMLCLELGYPNWACDSYRTWFGWQQDEGRWLNCDWTAGE